MCKNWGLLRFLRCARDPLRKSALSMCKCLSFLRSLLFARNPLRGSCVSDRSRYPMQGARRLLISSSLANQWPASFCGKRPSWSSWQACSAATLVLCQTLRGRAAGWVDLGDVEELAAWQVTHTHARRRTLNTALISTALGAPPLGPASGALHQLLFGQEVPKNLLRQVRAKCLARCRATQPPSQKDLAANARMVQARSVLVDQHTVRGRPKHESALCWSLNHAKSCGAQQSSHKHARHTETMPCWRKFPLVCARRQCQKQQMPRHMKKDNSV